MSRSPRMKVAGTLTSRRRGQRVLIGVAGVEIVVQHAAAASAAARAGRPGASTVPGARLPPSSALKPRPQIETISIASGSLASAALSRSGPTVIVGRGADQAQARRPCRDAARRSRARSASPWSGRPALPSAHRRASSSAAVQSAMLGDGRQRLAGRAAMTRQIRRQHRIAVMGEPAAVQCPGRMIEACAVQHHHRGQRGIERPAAGAQRRYQHR